MVFDGNLIHGRPQFRFDKNILRKYVKYSNRDNIITDIKNNDFTRTLLENT